MLKLYFILWVSIFAISIDILNNNIGKKIFRVDAILIFGLLALLTFKSFTQGLFNAPMIQIGIFNLEEDVFPEIKKLIILFLGIILALFTVLPEILKTVDLSNFKKIPEKIRQKYEIKSIKISPYVYVTIWAIFVCSWINIKAGNVIGEEEKHRLPNYIGMYYDQNCEYRKAVDMIQNFNANNILVTKYARENLEDMTADNTILFTESFYRTMWAMATLEYDGENIAFRDILNSTNQHNIKEAIENPNIKYIVRLDSKEENKIEEAKEDIENLNKIAGVEILYSNENGFVAKINR